MNKCSQDELVCSTALAHYFEMGAIGPGAYLNKECESSILKILIKPKHSLRSYFDRFIVNVWIPLAIDFAVNS